MGDGRRAGSVSHKEESLEMACEVCLCPPLSREELIKEVCLSCDVHLSLRWLPVRHLSGG